ncbi:MAG: aspartate kinase [Bacteroidales bacterium]
MRNLAGIVGRAGEKLVVVISAFGKTTNALEEVARKAHERDYPASELINRIEDNHNSIIEELLPDGSSASGYLADSFARLREFVNDPGSRDYDFIYDQVVSHGEIWSTRIIEEYLRSTGIRSCWMDIRELLITDDRYRDANILWSESTRNISKAVKMSDADVCVVQGFIGGTVSGHSTTLGREGSDYTAGVVANILDASRVEIWKDVPGILNADPGWMTDTHKLDFISYKDAVEMTFSGAKVIHPKTIKPLHNKGIPLFVRSFISPGEPGTEISSNESGKQSVPYLSGRRTRY